MGIVDLLLSTSSEESLNSRLGQWRMGVSTFVDSSLITLPYLTQTAWAINRATGNDSNLGTPAVPLQSIAEFVRRTFGRVFAPGITSVSVSISADDYRNDSDFIWGAAGSGGVSLPVNISGTMVPAGLSGTISAYQPWITGTTRGSLTDAAQDFTSAKQKRIRITSGTAQGAVTFIGSLGGGVTIANIGQFHTTVGLTGTLVNPSVGDGYIVENFGSRIRGYHIYAPNCSVILQDVSIESVASGVASCEAYAAQQFLIKVFGCQQNCIGIVHNISGNQLLLCLGIIGTGGAQTVSCFQTWKGCNIMGSQPVIHALGSSIQASATMHDGDGLRNAGMRCVDNSEVADTSQSRGFFGIINGTIAALARINGQSWYIEGSAQAWGAAGNTTTTAVQVLNGSGVSYDIKPSCTGASPGVNDVTISGTSMAWAAVPFAAAAPNNGYVNQRI